MLDLLRWSVRSFVEVESIMNCVDTPHVLLQNKASRFAVLVAETGKASTEKLQQQAAEADQRRLRSSQIWLPCCLSLRNRLIQYSSGPFARIFAWGDQGLDSRLVAGGWWLMVMMMVMMMMVIDSKYACQFVTCYIHIHKRRIGGSGILRQSHAWP